MDKKRIANQNVKNRLFSALLDIVKEKDLSKLTVTELITSAGVARASFYRNFTSIEELINYGIQEMALRYHEGKPASDQGLRDKDIMLYNFQFYQNYADLVLAFHHAKASTSLLDIITECEINSYGDMPLSSISRYELYYFSGAFYHILICWMESGMKESAQAMADEFLRIMHQG